MKCAQARALMALLLHGEAETGAETELREHCAACPDCAAESSRYGQLTEGLRTAGWRWDAPGEEDFHLVAQRMRLLARLPRGVREPRSRPAWAGVAAALMLAGFAGGWMSRGAAHAATISALEARSVGDARNGNRLAETALYRVDAIAASASADAVQISFDTLRHETIEASIGDPRIDALLVQAIQHPPNSGVRLDAISLLSQRPDLLHEQATMRAALTDALRDDPNPGVRLQALEALTPLASSGTANANGLLAALARTVLDDGNAGVRTEALDALAKAPASEAMPLLRAIGQATTSEAVRLRCAQALRQAPGGAPVDGWAPEARGGGAQP